MTDNTTAAKHSLTVRRTFNAPRERVFAAWTDPIAIAQWHAADEYVTKISEWSFRKGGGYRYEFQPKSKSEAKVVWGVFREIQAPERLVYTWNHENPEVDVRDTQVTVEFFDRDGQTEIVLKHEFFTTTEMLEGHKQGWNGCLDRLPETFK